MTLICGLISTLLIIWGGREKLKATKREKQEKVKEAANKELKEKLPYGKKK